MPGLEGLWRPGCVIKESSRTPWGTGPGQEEFRTAPMTVSSATGRRSPAGTCREGDCE